MIRSYTELISIPSFEERFEYLKLGGNVGEEVFGYDRWLNQVFYRSPEWKRVRRDAIIRDNGCDLACPDRQICGELIIVHHMNPITIDDIKLKRDTLLDMENLITMSYSTHQAVSFGDATLLLRSTPIERRPFDTSPWR